MLCKFQPSFSFDHSKRRSDGVWCHVEIKESFKHRLDWQMNWLSYWEQFVESEDNQCRSAVLPQVPGTIELIKQFTYHNPSIPFRGKVQGGDKRNCVHINMNEQYFHDSENKSNVFNPGIQPPRTAHEICHQTTTKELMNQLGF